MGAIFLFLFFMWLFKGFGKAMRHSGDTFPPINKPVGKVQQFFIYSSAHQVLVRRPVGFSCIVF